MAILIANTSLNNSQWLKLMINGFFGKYRFLSNFYDYPVRINGITFRSAENAFQSFKLADKSLREKTFATCLANQAKHLGKVIPLRSDWEDIKLDVMYQVVRVKFAFTPWLRARLLETGTQELVEENTWGDIFWGRVNGVGENHLGKILMRIRTELARGDY